MNNFDFFNPVHYYFGKDQHVQLSTLIPADAKVLMLYGGGSIKTTGVYDKVMDALKNHHVQEFGGIEPNPQFHTLLKALELIKREGITFLLAVGGGSVIDGTKFLSSAALYEGADPWDILAKGIRTEKGMPFGTVLTLPATGSEMNSGAVISRADLHEKRPMGGPGLFPQFSICDPTVVATLPERQLANGVIDAFTHVMEQYMTFQHGASLQDRLSEAVLSNLVAIGPQVVAQPDNYALAADFMWSCTMALNGLLQKGVPTDWSVHFVGHELTAAYNIDHARTLAIVLPSMYRYKLEQKLEKLAQYGRRVWQLEGSDREVAQQAIDRTEEFFQSLGVGTRISDYVSESQDFPKSVAQKMKAAEILLGEHKDIAAADVETILTQAL